MKRTKLNDRPFANYTRGEETANTLSHVAGAFFGLYALIRCLHQAADRWAFVTSIIYGVTCLALYLVSSLYHGLPRSYAKKVMQIIDHCSIYYFIAGTYTPILLCAIRPQEPVWAWLVLFLVWGCALFGSICSAIDLIRFKKLSMACYIGMGWCIILALKPTLATVPPAGLLWILAGGISYTIGAIFYGIGNKIRYSHTVFHVFVLAGSILQFQGIIGHVI